MLFIYLRFAFTYIVLPTKHSGRPDSPFLVKVNGCWTACGWARVQMTKKPFPNI